MILFENNLVADGESLGGNRSRRLVRHSSGVHAHVAEWFSKVMLHVRSNSRIERQSIAAVERRLQQSGHGIISEGLLQSEDVLAKARRFLAHGRFGRGVFRLNRAILTN